MLIDSLMSDTELRVIQLELALCSGSARRRLRREIRRGQADFAWAGADPVYRRLEAATNAWLCWSR